MIWSGILQKRKGKKKIKNRLCFSPHSFIRFNVFNKNFNLKFCLTKLSDDRIHCRYCNITHFLFFNSCMLRPSNLQTSKNTNYEVQLPVLKYRHVVIVWGLHYTHNLSNRSLSSALVQHWLSYVDKTVKLMFQTSLLRQ